ncbi:MAG: hypothetical protein ACFE0O_10075 [Opitutales bacterium]
MTSDTLQSRLAWSLLVLRLTVFIVFAFWTLDKFLNPEHTARVFANFYQIENLSAAMSYAIGTVQAVILLAFLVGFRKTVSYGLVLALHAVSTLSSFPQYLAPFEGPNLLFFAAWPMLGALIALFLLRDADRLWVVPAQKSATAAG